MLRGLDRSRLGAWLGVCLGGSIISLFTGGPIALLACLGGAAIGAEIALLMVKLAKSERPDKTESREQLEPALLPVLLRGAIEPDHQMRAAILELIYTRRLSLDRKDGTLWLAEGDHGVETSTCSEIVSLRVAGSLMDGPQRLSSVPSHMQRTHSTCFADIRQASLKAERSWSSARWAKVRTIAGVLLGLAGISTVLLLSPLGGLGIGLAAGLFWPTGRQLLKTTPYWAGQREAWARHIEQLHKRLPAPEPKPWGESLAAALAMGDQSILEEAESRIAISSDPHMKNLTQAALELGQD